MSPQYLLCTFSSSAFLLSAHILLCSLLAVSSVDAGLWFPDVEFKKNKNLLTFVVSLQIFTIVYSHATDILFGYILAFANGTLERRGWL